MKPEKKSQMQIRVSQPVKERLAQDVSERGVSLNDVIVGILADHFDVVFEGTGRPSRGIRKIAEGSLCIHVPPALAKKIRVASARQGTTNHAIVDAVVRDHYELAVAA